jgi:hypothetical protein
MCIKMKWFVAMLLVLGVCTDAVVAELIGYWPFEEGQGTTTADITGNGNDGTFNGSVEWVPGYIGSAVSFDTAGERIVIGPLDPTEGTDAMTLAAWILWEGEGHTIAHQGIIGKRLGWDPGTGVKWFWETTPAGDLVFRADNAGGGTGLWWGNAILMPYANEWTHIAVTWDDGAAVEYINAEEVENGNITFREGADATPMTIGCVDSTNTETFVGSIDEVRIFNHALSVDEIQTIMIGEFPNAYNPSPADGAIHEDTWVSLSWQAGTLAVSHDVYVGENFDDVNEGTGGTFRGNQELGFFVLGFPGYPYPDGLVPGTTYYWRIDEVNDADTDSPWKGEVWSFTVPPKTAFQPVPADGAELVAVNARLSWMPGFDAKLHYVVFGEDFDEVNNAALGVPSGTANYTPGPLKLAKTYYWRVDEFDGFETHKGDVWSFTTTGAVSGANPANGAVGVSATQILTWDAGAIAASHEVYFGSDADAVANATKSSPEYKGPKALGEESYDPGKLALSTTYYWRIDEVNNANPDSPWAGNVWSFTTGNFFAIDDFEGYDAGENQIWYAWHDGLGYGTPGTADFYAGNGTGAAVGDETTASYTEETIVHGGGQSMPFTYDNNKQGYSKYSEVELTLSTLRDWTSEGVAELSLWFRGNPASVGGFVEGPVGTYTMTGSGTDIWGTADEFHYAFKTLTGVGSIVAKVLSVDNTDPWAKAGVMIRETLEPGSKFAAVYITPGNGCRFQGRTDTGIDATSDTAVVTTEQTAITAPYWVKIERDVAGNFRGYYSANGTAWTPMSWNPQYISMSSNVYVGLAVTAHNAALTCEATFSNVTITGSAGAQWMNQDIGIASNDAEPLYVALSNSAGAPAVVYHDDPAAANIDTWTEWVIPLQAFTDQGINLTNVDRIAIGMGTQGNMTNPGGSGKMYIDDIRLYQSRTAP